MNYKNILFEINLKIKTNQWQKVKNTFVLNVRKP